jgi:hypothetical protein
MPGNCLDTAEKLTDGSQSAGIRRDRCETGSGFSDNQRIPGLTVARRLPQNN